MNLKPFQQATVARALEALMDPFGSRRFLVADEVGLGKTRVAQGVIDGLCRAKGRRLNVFYICSSLSIARQNRESLLELVPEDLRAVAGVDVDRLTLLPETAPSRRVPFSLFTLTPGTLPVKNRAGRVDERAVIWHMLCAALPELARHGSLREAFRQNVSSETWSAELQEGLLRVGRATQAFVAQFRKRLGQRFDCVEGAWTTTLIDALKSQLLEDDKEVIRKCRLALSVAALENLAPDLVILDEFQRFFEFLEEDDDDRDPQAQELMKHLLGHGAGESLASVLLLSATPYQLYTGWGERAGGHYAQFYRLLKFLHGAQGAPVEQLKADFQEYQRRLQKDPVGSTDVFAVRDRIRETLGRVIVRTERPASLMADDAQRIEVVTSPLGAPDVRLFRHLRDSALPAHRGMVPGFWSSIPFPLQMMDDGYVLQREAQLAQLGESSASVELQAGKLRCYADVPTPHPRLRALLEEVSDEFLSLPWLPPSRPWWALGGVFKDAQERQAGTPLSKVLIFSGYRAVPRALAAFMSYRAELKAMAPLEQRRRTGRPVKYDYRARRGSDEGRRPRQGLVKQPAASFNFATASRPEHAMRVLLMFFPLPELARLGDPLPTVSGRDGDVQRTDVLEAASARIEAALGMGVDPSSRPLRPVWRWAAFLERNSPLREAWMPWCERSRGGTEGIKRTANAFLDYQERPPPPTRRELAVLARMAVLSPASVLLRGVERVFGLAPDLSRRLAQVLETSVDGLRGYLDLPEFHVLLRRKGRDNHLRAVRRAIWDGNLESVLDEHLSYLCGLGVESPSSDAESRALEALREALGAGAISVRVHKLGRKDETFAVRCHAALPFGLSASEVVSDVSGAFRNATLRTAFNSPFRPHVLATTSIGQEGLDFHAWCRHLVHWDLPGNPVDLEQREGRINRYASLAIRQALAARMERLPAEKSPWRAFGLEQEQRLDGLAPWWGCEGAEIRRTTYVTPYSRSEASVEELGEARMLYRLALGQVDQEQLVRTLRRRMELAGNDAAELEAWLDEVRIDLSPTRSSSAPPRRQRRAR